jgi:hypothetical protein
LRRVLRPSGTLIQSFGDGGRWFGPLGHLDPATALDLFVGQTLKSFTAKETTETLDELRELNEAGRLAPVIASACPARRRRPGDRSRGARKPRRQGHRHRRAATDSAALGLTRQPTRA